MAASASRVPFELALEGLGCFGELWWAGISRSGAVGEVLNDYFNKYLEFNALDDEYFRRLNRQIQGNPLVRRVLRETLFGKGFM